MAEEKLKIIQTCSTQTINLILEERLVESREVIKVYEVKIYNRH